MKLKSLTIKGNGYKNLKGTFPFEKNNGYIALIGLNGSGKSNLIEAISIIFDKLINSKGKDIPFDYSIEYKIVNNTYIISNDAFIKNGKKCSINNIEFPSSIIACYSGEDKRLWSLAYEDSHYSYFKKAVNDESRFNPSLLYIDKSCWSIAFLSLLCSEEPEIKSFLKDKLHVNSPTDIEIVFTIDDTKKTAFKRHSALSWFDRVCSNGKIDVNGNLLSSTDIMLAGKTALGREKAKIVFSFLYLLSQPEKKIGKNNIQRLITGIKIKVNGICFDDLSEGEKKLILIECITKVLGDENSLLLLDEPDAHTHIAMKKDLLKLISEFEGQTIMTTHSPMFLNKNWDGFQENNIFYMYDGKIEDTEPLKHLAELTDNEIDYFKGSFIISSRKILVVEGKYDDKYLRKAIEIHAKSNPKYKKLCDIVMFSANGASEAEEVYEQSLKQSIDRIEKLVFLFDYDDGGWKGGWQKIKRISEGNIKIVPLFYQDNYSSTNYPTEDEDVKLANNQQRAITKTNSYMVEDLFSGDAYLDVIKPVISSRTHRDFNSLNIGKKGTVGAIKEHIEKNYNSFQDEWYDGFKPVLDKLLEVFDLN